MGAAALTACGEGSGDVATVSAGAAAPSYASSEQVDREAFLALQAEHLSAGVIARPVAPYVSPEQVDRQAQLAVQVDHVSAGALDQRATESTSAWASAEDFERRGVESKSSPGVRRRPRAPCLRRQDVGPRVSGCARPAGDQRLDVDLSPPLRRCPRALGDLGGRGLIVTAGRLRPGASIQPGRNTSPLADGGVAGGGPGSGPPPARGAQHWSRPHGGEGPTSGLSPPLSLSTAQRSSSGVSIPIGASIRSRLANQVSSKATISRRASRRWAVSPPLFCWALLSARAT